VVDKLVEATRLNAPQYLACQYAGIHPDTLRKYLAAGISDLADLHEGKRRKKTRCAILVERLEKAEGEAVVRDLARIERAAKNGAWQAAAWRLERRYPQLFGMINRFEVTGAGGGPIEVEPVRDRLASRIADLRDVSPSKPNGSGSNGSEHGPNGSGGGNGSTPPVITRGGNGHDA